MGRPDRARSCLVERDLPAAWAGRKLAELGEPERFKVVAITRMGSARIAAGELVGQEGDILHFVVAVDDLPALDERLTDEGIDMKGHH